MCLPVCPTYALTNDEQSSPRGRIRLLRELHAGNLTLGDTLVDEMYFCLDCQACQTACPAGVQYGELVEDARAIIAERKLDPIILRVVRSLLLRRILGSRKWTKFFARLLRLYQRSGFSEAVETSGLLNIFPPSVAEKHKMLPRISEKFFDEEAPSFIPHRGEFRGNVALLSGCMMNVAFAGIHDDTVEVLRHNGFGVAVPSDQACCGSLLAHYGGIADARAMARKTIDAFAGLDADAIVVDSAGCAAFMKEYGRTLADDTAYAEKAVRCSTKTKEITEFLAGMGFARPEGALDEKVTYHDACHLVHTQKISQQPRELLRSVSGDAFVELPEASWCCGSAGIYNVVRYEDSMKFLGRKMEHLRSTGADIVATANPGCHLQLQYGVKREGMAMEVAHPVSVLRRAYDAAASRKQSEAAR